MKPHLRTQTNQALTLFEVLVSVLITILLFAVLFAMILPVYEAGRRRSDRINCVNNLRQINMALRVWQGESWP